MTKSNAKTIVLFIPNRKVAKEYAELFPTGELEKDYNVSLLYGQTVFKNSAKKFDQILFKNYIRTTHAFLHRCLLWHKKFSSLAYTLRAFQYFGLKKDVQAKSNLANYNDKRHKFIFRMLIYLFGNYLGVKIMHLFVNFLFRIKAPICSDIFSGETHCVILPYSGGVSLEFDYIVWACKQKQIMSIAIQENWDNLSSKSLLLNHPDHFLTWGKQSSSHLRSIQQFKGSIHEIGSLRLNSFYKYRDTHLKNNKHLKKNGKPKIFSILLVGTGPTTHDFQLVKNISQYLSINKNSQIKIFYRPHPYFKSSNNDLNQISKLKNVTVYNSTIEKKNTERRNQFLKSSVIVGLYSTVIYEASILNKPCIIPSFIVPNKGYETYNLLNDISHYSGMSILNNIYNAKTEKHFWSIISELQEMGIPKINSSSLLHWFCNDTDSKKEITKYINNLI